MGYTAYESWTIPEEIYNFLNQGHILEVNGADNNKEELLLITPLGYPFERYKKIRMWKSS